MDLTRKASREANEITLQYKSRQEITLDEELIEDDLSHLLLFTKRLEETPLGAIELERRRKLFGECNRIDGESSGQFYGRLRQWMERELPQAKAPLHEPRQMGG